MKASILTRDASKDAFIALQWRGWPGSSSRPGRRSGIPAGCAPQPLREVAMWMAQYRDYLGRSWDRVDTYPRGMDGER